MESEAKTKDEVNNVDADEAEEEQDEDFVPDTAAEEPEAIQGDDIEEPDQTEGIVEDIVEEFATMTVVCNKPSSAPFSMGFSFPCVMCQRVEGGRRRVSIDFLVIGMGKENHRPKVINNGKRLQLGMVAPSFFADENRLQVANEFGAGFNARTHKATALEEVANKITENVDSEEPLIGCPQQVELPVPCEDEIDDWEMLAFDNDDVEWSCDLEAQQHFFVLSVNLVSAIKVAKKKKKGGFRALGNARRQINEEEEDEDGEESPTGAGNGAMEED